MKSIANPFLPGFHPDPSILRVGDDYYVVTSTFEWFPGFEIHHSRDLRHWQLVKRPLERVSQLDLYGVPDSCGVWAPCLSEREGVFYLPYTNVRSFDGAFIDTPNYLVTSTDIRGEWSEPIYLHSSGFDVSFFHDDNGRSWLSNMVVDHRGGRLFGGIVLQEFDHESKRLVGPIHKIFEGTQLGRTEGPHLYKRDGYYHLIVAEGGTGREHAVTMARSRSITGPYELHPENPILSTHHHPEWPLQKTGHGDLVETQDGDWYLVFLASRPLPNGRCTLGRESAIERVHWRDDGWLELARPEGDDGTFRRVPRVHVEAPDLPDHPFETTPERLDFNSSTLDDCFQSLRVPITSEWADLEARPGFLRLYGRDSLQSTFEQSLVARRVEAHRIEVETCVEFSPRNFQQMAGLVCYYNTYHYHYLHIRGDEYGSNDSRVFLDILTCDKYDVPTHGFEAIELSEGDRFYLKATIDGEDLQFYYGTVEGAWHSVGPVLDASILSDDYVEDLDVRFRPCFTGAFVGLACQDLSGRGPDGRGLHADFDFFTYREVSQP